MIDHTDRLQMLSFGLIIIALFAIAAADHYNLRDLANAGLTVLGTGAGILTGKQLSQTTQTGDITNPTPPPNSPVPPVKLGV